MRAPAPPARRPAPRRPSKVAVLPARMRVGRILLIGVLLAATVKLVTVQTIQAGELTAASQRQASTAITIPAERGAILDRDGRPLAFSVDARAIVTNPLTIAKGHPDDLHEYATRMATAVAEATGQDQQALYDLITSNRGYVVLARLVDPAVARRLSEEFVEIAEERREDRQYPAGTLASTVIGAATWDADGRRLAGRVGLESSQENVLAGSDGLQVVDTAEGSNTVIPGSTRFERAAVQGSTIQLTLDSDLQFTVQKALADHVARTGAKGTSSAVVLDAKTGEVRALATGRSFDPRNLSAAQPEDLGNPAVSSPFEPGSVNKVVTMAAALEHGIAQPDDVLAVPDSIKVADRTIHDAWEHGVENYTLTGVLAKSSNVGTIMTAQRVGEERFSEMLARFGLGQRTGIELPGESAGRVPARETWSGSTFGNLPIGQGLSMTVLQMAGMYQAIANDGVRIPPRIIASVTGPDGVRTVPQAPDAVQVISPETAAKLRTMLIAVTQKGPRGQSQQTGTGPQAAVPGYEVAGKTGTAQQVDPNCGCYSSSTYWITFAGMMPAENPRYVIAIMLDAPRGGTSAAPLFHDIASYLGQRDRLPVTDTPPRMQTLVVP
ncbi:peptidoglycan D,D-transpeptidase FtsI family protein [Pseudonocardia thermophila]|uniref:peptidoglycan D,D-transpeptidase FtsI family protein n=1 Tax=Pseudonocardia thermophila TaxID=1848 RepID=UPI001F160B78|nr:penicillin-binding protein 2 [Pseudonocardia thermophila]